MTEYTKIIMLLKGMYMIAWAVLQGCYLIAWALISIEFASGDMADDAIDPRKELIESSLSELMSKALKGEEEK